MALYSDKHYLNYKTLVKYLHNIGTLVHIDRDIYIYMLYITLFYSIKTMQFITIHPPVILFS